MHPTLGMAEASLWEIPLGENSSLQPDEGGKQCFKSMARTEQSICCNHRAIWNIRLVLDILSNDKAKIYTRPTGFVSHDYRRM